MTYNEMWRQLAQVYGDGEAKAIARMVYEIRYGLSLSDILLGKDTQLTADHQAELKEITERLQLGKSTIHHHLKLLRAAKLVDIHDGKYVLRKKAFN